MQEGPASSIKKKRPPINWAEIMERINDLFGTEHREEWPAFRRLVKYYKGNLGVAAKELGLCRGTLAGRVKRLGIRLADFAPNSRDISRTTHEPIAVEFDEAAWAATGYSGSPCRHCTGLTQSKQNPTCHSCIHRSRFVQAERLREIRDTRVLAYPGVGTISSGASATGIARPSSCYVQGRG